MNDLFQSLIDRIPESFFRLYGPILGVLFALGILMLLKKRTRTFGTAVFISCALAAAAGYAFQHGGADYIAAKLGLALVDSPTEILPEATTPSQQSTRPAYVISAATFLVCSILFVATGRLFPQGSEEDEV